MIDLRKRLFRATTAELEELLLFAIVTAGKRASIQARKLHELLRIVHGHESPFHDRTARAHRPTSMERDNARPISGYDQRSMRGGKQRLLFHALIEREGDRYSALCLELNVASEGATPDEATDNLREAVKDICRPCLIMVCKTNCSRDSLRMPNGGSFSPLSQ